MPRYEPMNVKCIHFWLVNADNLGICKRCGEVKNFAPLIERCEKLNKLNLRGKRAMIKHDLSGEELDQTEDSSA